MFYIEKNFNNFKKVDYIFVTLAGFILFGSFSLQKSLGDVIKDEADLSTNQKDVNQKKDKKNMTFLKRRK